MIFDSVLLAAVASELRSQEDFGIVGATVRDVWQSDEAGEESRAVYVQFRESALLIDTHPRHARLHLVQRAPRAPNSPSSLTQTLRKTLRGARLVQISQPNFDRALRLKFSSRNTVGELVFFTLVAELMERRSNLILLDNDDIIIDAVKRLPPFLNRVRTILPHRPYEPPPSEKENPLSVEDWAERLNPVQSTPGFDLVLWLRQRFTGISPLAARVLQGDLEYSSCPAQVCTHFFGAVNRAARGDFSPVLCGNQPYPLDFGGCEHVAAPINVLLERAATRDEEQGELESERSALLAYLTKREKINRAQSEDLAKGERHAHDAEGFKAIGNLLLANMAEVEAALDAHASSVLLQDESGQTMPVAIEPNWSPGDNANRYFNRYRRAQKLAAGAPERRRVLNSEREQLTMWRAAAETATTQEELARVARAAAFDRVRKTKTASRTKQQEEAARPESKLREREIEGWRVWMGRSAEENQTLLSKVASPSDVWMHVRDAPSAHVLVKNQKGQTPPPRVLEEAARWLAQSARRGQSGETLEIIYTQAKWVRAVKGAPGRVTLGRFQTLLVTT